MAKTILPTKSCTVNPLKMSQPIGAALAFMGLKGCMPILHGSQGCTSFGLVLFVRHFKEAIPLQTTAMSEVDTVLGGYENVEKAVVNIYKRAKPDIIGFCSTGVTETKGDDVEGYLKQIRAKYPEYDHMPLIYVSTPDFKDAFQDGWHKVVTALINQVVEAPAADAPLLKDRINVLPGCHLTPGDLDELRDIFDDFGLQALFLPDISGSLDGHIPEDFTPTTLGGISIPEIRTMAQSGHTIAIGLQMEDAAKAYTKKTGQPVRMFDRLTGLAANDAFIAYLAEITGRPVPNKYRRQRGQLVDAMLDGHFYFGGVKVAFGAEPDLLYSVGSFLHEMGAELTSCITTTQSPALDLLPADEVLIGDLEDLETQAKERECELLITHAHGRMGAERLKIPFFRLGLPIFDRLGAGHIVTVGYRGTRDLIFDIGNLLMAQDHEPDPDTWKDWQGGLIKVGSHSQSHH